MENNKNNVHVFLTLINTPIGRLIACASETNLYLLDFAEDPCIYKNLHTIHTTLKADIFTGANPIITELERQLVAYFNHQLTLFTIPIQPLGTPFQQSAWNTLTQIPYGNTISYQEQALQLQKPQYHRAVAKANSNNKILILIPCHRVIHKNGHCGGYKGNPHHKEFLLHHERVHSKRNA